MRKQIFKQDGLNGQTNPQTGYKYLGFNGDSLSEKTGATVSGIGGLSYKVYTAVLTQTSTNPPVATILENTLGFVPVWSYTGFGGNYTLTEAGGFPISSTWVVINQGQSNGSEFISAVNESNDTIVVRTDSGGSANDILDNTSFEVRVYS